ncbi:MAG: hypothetical protein WBV73_26875, partial [Phormidium sp.]
MPISWQDLGRRFIPGFSPYRGLFAFQEEDTSFFFGRESFTAQLVEAVGKHSLVAVIGASGSGKSSVVFAGLIPCLRREGNWRVMSLRPGDRPLYNLASALISRLESGMSKTDRIREIRKLANDLGQEEGALRDILGEIEREDSGTRLLLVVDQFEELYTLSHNVEERQRFLDRLLEAVNHTKNFNLVITLRADFVGHALSYRPLADALQYADLKLGPMNRQELQDAIAKPAYQVGVEIEEGLTERILTAVNEEPGNLPLLEFALTQLWEKRRGGILSHAAYDEIGGVEAALARYAQEVYEKLKLEEQQAAKRIFLELTQLGEGTADTRRQVLKQDLLRLAQSEDLIERVIQRLASAKLMVTNELEPERIAGEDSHPSAVVDVVHEALIQYWPLLRQWVNENRDALRIQRKIETAAQEWQGKGKPKQAAYLLQGPKLAEAENFSQSYADTVALSSLAQEFVHRSIQQRRKSRLILFGSIGAFVVVVSGAAIVSNVLRVEAQRQATIAQLREKVVTVKNLLSSPNPVDGLVLAIEATGQSLSAFNEVLSPVQSSLLSGTQMSLEINRIDHDQEVSSVAFSPDGQYIASISGGKLRLWNIQGNPIDVSFQGHESDISAIAFSPDGQYIVTGSGKTVQLLDLKGNSIAVFRGHEEPVTFVPFSADGQYIISGNDKETIRFWDFKGNQRNLFRWGERLATSFAISPDGQYIVSGGVVKISFWDLNGNKIAEDKEGHSRF